MQALLLVATGNEEIEFCALVDVLRRADVEVTVSSVETLCTSPHSWEIRVKLDR